MRRKEREVQREEGGSLAGTAVQRQVAERTSQTQVKTGEPDSKKELEDSNLLPKLV